jgi:hypothetical protein
MKDARLVERALRERWPIPKALRKPLIERLNEIVQDTASSPREVTSAAKAILEASKINMAAIGTVIKARQAEDFAERLEELERRTEQGENLS